MTSILDRDASIFDILNGSDIISESAVRRLYNMGYSTVGSVAVIENPLKTARAIGVSSNDMLFIVHTAQYRTAMVVKRRDPVFLPGIPLYFDIETNLAWNKIWLIGVLDGKDDKFYPFYANTFDEERTMLKEFGEFLEVRKNQPLLYYSCNGFDVRIIKNSCNRLGLNDHPIFEHLEQDICGEIRKSYYIPTKNRRLKTLVKFLGFDMSLENHEGYMNGKECAQMYEAHSNYGLPLNPVVFEYNQNDCKMLKFLIQRLEEVSIVNGDYISE